MFEVKAQIKPTGKPLLNEAWFTTTPGDTTFTNQPFSYKTFMIDFKRCPEALGITNAIRTDIISDGILWFGKKLNIKKAQTFSKKSNIFTEKMPAALFDWMVFGNALIWLGLSQKQFKELAYDAISKKMPEVKSYERAVYATDITNEMQKSVVDFRVIPWSTVSIINDATDILQFKQTVSHGQKERFWDVNTVIHAKFMDLDGKAYGYSPMISASSVITTLNLIKDYNGYFFENSGRPDNIFVFPEEMEGSPSIETFKRMLQEKKDSRNKRGDMVITSQCDIKRVDEGNNDMQYRDLSIQYAGTIAFAFNMPLTRIQSLVGSDNKAKPSDLSDSGYWRSISVAQSYWEDMLNDNLYKPFFDVEIKFKRSYKQDEVREAQVKMFNVQWLQAMQGGLKLKPTKNYLKDILGLDEESVDWASWEKMDVKDLTEPMGQGPQASNNKLFKTESEQQNDEVKRRKQVDKPSV